MKTLGLWRQQATFQRRAFLSNSVSYYQCQPPFYLVKIPTTEALNTRVASFLKMTPIWLQDGLVPPLGTQRYHKKFQIDISNGQPSIAD